MTPERLARLAQVLDQRQPDLTVVMDEVNKPHNLSAIIRSADAVGVAEVQAVWPKHAMRMVASAAKGSHDWVLVHTHPDIGSCVATLKARGMQVLATHLDDTAVDYRAVDYTRPTAILLGAEIGGAAGRAAATGRAATGRAVVGAAAGGESDGADDQRKRRYQRPKPGLRH